MKRIIGTTLCILVLLVSVGGVSAETNDPETKPTVADNERSETGILVVEKESDEEEPQLIEEETYYFDDADYTVNGLEVHIESITLKRGYKPEGYSVYVSYQVKNQNSTEATFEFSSLDGNCFEYDGAKTTLNAQATWSSTHVTKVHLKSNEISDQMTGDFYAVSLNWLKTISGTTYGPIDISELYTGQEISIDLSMTGYIGDSTESMIASFEIGL